MRARGYIGHIMANGRSVPQSVQQQVIREYCKKNHMDFLLSVVEFAGSDIVLNTALDGDSECIVFYSIHLLPKDRTKLYKTEKKIHFAAENIVGINQELFTLMDICAS